jgi:RimJ/RimL family protein N-acetyltransferase
VSGSAHRSDGAPGGPTIRELDEATLAGVLGIAVADASPGEVMPVPPGTTSWTPPLARRFRDHHRDRFDGLDGEHGELCFVVEEAARPVGVARLARHAEGTLEVGVWLARAVRSRGLGTELLPLLRAAAAARGASLVARTTADNRAAVLVLTRAGARLSRAPDGTVIAVLPPPAT